MLLKKKPNLFMSEVFDKISSYLQAVTHEYFSSTACSTVTNSPRSEIYLILMLCTLSYFVQNQYIEKWK